MDSLRAQSHAPLDDLSFEAGYLFKYPTTQEKTVAKRYREYLAHLMFVAGRVHENPQYRQQVQDLCNEHRVTTAVDHGKKFDFLFGGEKKRKKAQAVQHEERPGTCAEVRAQVQRLQGQLRKMRCPAADKKGHDNGPTYRSASIKAVVLPVYDSLYQIISLLAPILHKVNMEYRGNMEGGKVHGDKWYDDIFECTRGFVQRLQRIPNTEVAKVVATKWKLTEPFCNYIANFLRALLAQMHKSDRGVLKDVAYLRDLVSFIMYVVTEKYIQVDRLAVANKEFGPSVRTDMPLNEFQTIISNAFPWRRRCIEEVASLKRYNNISAVRSPVRNFTGRGDVGKTLRPIIEGAGLLIAKVQKSVDEAGLSGKLREGVRQADFKDPGRKVAWYHDTKTLAKGFSDSLYRIEDLEEAKIINTKWKLSSVYRKQAARLVDICAARLRAPAILKQTVRDEIVKKLGSLRDIVMYVMYAVICKYVHPERIRLGTLRYKQLLKDYNASSVSGFIECFKQSFPYSIYATSEDADLRRNECVDFHFPDYSGDLEDCRECEFIK